MPQPSIEFQPHIPFVAPPDGVAQWAHPSRDDDHRFHELLDALPAAVYTTDAAGRITFFNEAAAELWGHRPELGRSEWCADVRLEFPPTGVVCDIDAPIG